MLAGGVWKESIMQRLYSMLFWSLLLCGECIMSCEQNEVCTRFASAAAKDLMGGLLVGLELLPSLLCLALHLQTLWADYLAYEAEYHHQGLINSWASN